jgi:DNA-binding LacI/PurR family transcriptional regulator
MGATIRDVAQAAGVSPSTVSRALSMSELVNQATRERVRQAANRLGYRPNRAARGLITGRTGNLGLIVPDLANPFFPSIVKGIQTRARELDYAVFLADADEDPDAEPRLVRALAKQVDGMVLCSPRMTEADLHAVSTGTTLVMVNRRVGSIPALTLDNAGGMRQAIAHLQALRHIRVAWVGGPRDSWSNRERRRALRGATAAAGMDLVDLGNFVPQFAGGVAAADLVVAAGVTAVITYNDLVALGLLSRLRAREIAVPGELSVIGTDDIPLSGMSSPALTTVALPMEQAGRQSVDLLLSLLEDRDAAAPARRELPTQLLVRDSTGVAPCP